MDDIGDQDRDQARAWVCFGALALLLAVCMLGGGASRTDVASLLFVRPIAALCLIVTIFIGVSHGGSTMRTPLILLGALAATMLVQLVPLPPNVWMALPGHRPFAEAAIAAGIPQPWRPISLTPDYTINALLALLPAAAALVAFIGFGQRQRRAVVMAVIVAALGSGILGILQLASGSDSALYLYRVSHDDVAVGVFANRNHQATLLAIALPALRVWSMMRVANGREGWLRGIAAGIAGVFLLLMILATGSRAGALLGVIGIAAAVFCFGPLPRIRFKSPLVLAVMAATLLVCALGVFAFMSGRAAVFGRLAGVDAMLMESRFALVPVTWQMAMDFFPFGSGFGSFDPIFGFYEPDAALDVVYFNHAHNDLLELAIIGGILPLIALAAFLIWLTRHAFHLWGRSSSDISLVHGRLGVICIIMIFAASLVDYPLRTPMMSVIFAAACGWVAASRFARRSTGFRARQP